MSASEQTPSDLINPEDAVKYWSNIEANDNGMLGGFPHITRVDLLHSKNVLQTIIKKWEAEGGAEDAASGRVLRAADGGAGIGRITKGLLLKQLKEVDMIEPIKKFTDVIVEEAPPGLGEIFNVGLQEWFPREDRKYSVIWVQWALGHLNDVETVKFVKRALAALQPGGRLVVKENITSNDEDLFDEDDSSVTRSDVNWKRLFKEAGATIDKEDFLKGIPKSWGLFRIRCFVLKP